MNIIYQLLCKPTWCNDSRSLDGEDPTIFTISSKSNSFFLDGIDKLGFCTRTISSLWWSAEASTSAEMPYGATICCNERSNKKTLLMLVVDFIIVQSRATPTSLMNYIFWCYDDLLQLHFMIQVFWFGSHFRMYFSDCPNQYDITFYWCCSVIL